MAKRIRVSEPIPSAIENPTPAQLRRFYIIAKNLNSPETRATITDEDFKFFNSIGIGGFDEAKFNSLASELNRERKAGDPPVNPAVVKQYIDQARLQVGSPENKDRLARIMAMEDAKNKNTAFGNAVNLFLAGTDLMSAQRQINEYKRNLKTLSRPGTLPVQGRDPYLAAALRSAETAPARETVASLAAGQQLGDIYRAELMQAPVAAAGQAGAFGALAQTAATRRRRGAMEMMPALEQIRAQQQQERAQLAGMSAQEGANINRSMQTAQAYAIEQSNKEQEALAKLGAAGRQNTLAALGQLGQSIYDIYGNRSAQVPTMSTVPVETPTNKYTSTATAMGIPENKIDQWGWNKWQGNAPVSLRRSARMAAVGLLPEQVRTFMPSGMSELTGETTMFPWGSSTINEFENY